MLLLKKLEPYIVIKGETYSERAAFTHKENSYNVGNRKYEVPDVDKSNKREGYCQEERVKVLVDLNSADSIEFVSVRGIGPYYARQIIKYRDRLGGFVSKEQLLEINKMTEERYEPIAQQVTVNTPGVAKIDFKRLRDKNDESFREFLRRHPYVGYHTLKGIEIYIFSLQIDSLNKITPVQLLEYLHLNNLISKEIFDKLLPYIK